MSRKANPQSVGVFEKYIQPDITDKFRQLVTSDVDLTVVDSKPFNFRSRSCMNICLRPWSDFPEIILRALVHNVVDEDMSRELKERKVLNWCRTSKPLFPVKTTGDGNCLLHAISLFLWGIQDTNMLLRRLLCVSLGNDSAGSFKQRWRKERGYVSENVPGLNLNSTSWDEEWEIVLKQVDDTPHSNVNQLPYSCLEEIHVFIMANILKRPIIVLCDPMLRSPFGLSIQDNNFGGIYLPLLWEEKDCYKYPIVLGYSNLHFCPLVSQSSQLKGTVSRLPVEDVVPLVEFDQCPLRLHFLLDKEEPRADILLSRYLMMTEVVHTTSESVNTILAAKLNTKEIPDDINILKLFFQAFERSFVQDRLPSTPVLSSPRHGIQEPQGKGSNQPLNPHQYPESRNCLTPGCKMIGTLEMNYLCSRCFENFSKRDAEQEMLHRKRQLMKEELRLTPQLFEVEPLDERKLLPSENHSYQNSHKAHLYLKSPSTKECVGPSCQNKTSPDFELCEECLNKLKLIQKPKLPHNESELFGPGIVNTGVQINGKTTKEAAVQTSPCKTQGCFESGKGHLHDRCLKCYLQYGNSVCSVNEQNVETHGKPSAVEPLPQSPNEQRESWSVAEAQKHLCATPGCVGLRLQNSQGLCSACSELTQTPRKTVDEAVGAWLNQQPLVESTPQESLPRSYDSQLLESRSPSISCSKIQNGGKQQQTCATPWCSNQVASTQQLCDPCLNVLSSAKAKKGVCPTEGCKFHGAPEFDGYCSKCFNSLKRKKVPKSEIKSKSRPSSHLVPTRPVNVTQKSYTAPLFPQGRPCLTTNCTRFGDPSMQGLCTRCFQNSSHSAYHMPTGLPPRSDLYKTPTFPKSIQQASQIKVAQGGQTDLVVSGSDPSQYRLAGKSQLVTSESNEFERRMMQVEALRKTKNCKNASRGCANYGSDARQGYCSNCYDILRGEDVVDGQVLM